MIMDTQKSIFSIMVSTNANWFIYYFKRLPLVGKILPDDIYGNTSLKKNVAIIAAIVRTLKNLLGKALFVGLFLVLPIVLIEKDSSLCYSEYLHVFFVMSVLGPLLTSSIFEFDRNLYVCVRLMHMDAKSYIVSTVLFRGAVDAICSLPAVLFATVWMGGSVAQGLALIVIMAGFSSIGEAFFLLVYSGTGAILCNRIPYVISIAVLCLSTTYVPVLLHRPLMLSDLIFHPVFMVLVLVLSACCVSVILRFDRYREIVSDNLKVSEFTTDTNKVMAEAKFSDVAVREKEFSESDLKSSRFENKDGFAYLNAIFFERHKRLMVTPIIRRLIGIAVLFIAAIVISYLMPSFIEPLANPSTVLPVFVLIMYFASIGERICKAMFYNCDISLLKYSFYRDKNAILSNFIVRILRVAGLNLVVAFAIAAAVVGLALVFRLNWAILDMVLFALSILFLSLFFSVHHLFLYYVFQPYTAELGMKNPFFGVINGGVYLLCLFCANIKSPPAYFALIVLASTCAYIAIALILVYRYAPRTFRVK